jgi:RpiR family transcriptional regulator, carbohydrate utilization regulator
MHQSNPGGNGLLGQIARSVATLGPAEIRVAEVIQDDPHAVTQMSISTLAAKAEVSDPTVIRLCRKLGCNGFPDFKLRLAQCIVQGTPYVHREITEADSTKLMTGKIFGSTIATLTSVLEAFDVIAAEKAIQALARAHRVDFFGTGPSSIVARDAQQKFLHLDVPSVFQADTHMQIMSASTLSSTDVAVCFSYSGRTVDVVQCANIARKSGATVIGVTRSSSPLSQACTINICINTLENPSIFPAMTTRLAHLVVVDILSTGVTLRRGPGIADRLRLMKEAVADKRITDK